MTGVNIAAIKIGDDSGIVYGFTSLPHFLKSSMTLYYPYLLVYYVDYLPTSLQNVVFQLTQWSVSNVSNVVRSLVSTTIQNSQLVDVASSGNAG